MAGDLARLRAEAVRLGLTLSEEDLAAIGTMLEKTRAGLAAARPEPPAWDEPPSGITPLLPPTGAGPGAEVS